MDYSINVVSRPNTGGRRLLVSKLKALVRDSAALQIAQRLSGPMARRFQVETMPGWFARMHGISVPARITPLPAPSPSSSANIKIILSLVKQVVDRKGDLAECGVYRGATLIPLGLYLKQHGIQKTLYGLDSFEGFGDVNYGGAVETAYITKHGNLSDTSYNMVQAMVDHFGLTKQTPLVRGFFDKTLSTIKDRRFCFVHLDVDLYDSYMVCLKFFYERMMPGGIILLDEYNDPPFPGCNRAVDEFLADKPEGPLDYSIDNYIKYIIRKS